MLGNNNNYAHGTNIYICSTLGQEWGKRDKWGKKYQPSDRFDDDCSPTMVEGITAILKTLVLLSAEKLIYSYSTVFHGITWTARNLNFNQSYYNS